VFVDVKRSFNRRRLPIDLRHFSGYDSVRVAADSEPPHVSLRRKYTRPYSDKLTSPADAYSVHHSIACPYIQQIFTGNKHGRLFNGYSAGEMALERPEIDDGVPNETVAPLIDTGLFTMSPFAAWTGGKADREPSALFETVLAVNSQDSMEQRRQSTATTNASKQVISSYARPRLTVVFESYQLEDSRDSKLCEWWTQILGAGRDPKTTVRLLDAGKIHLKLYPIHFHHMKI
jgi:hypothetical protein